MSEVKKVENGLVEVSTEINGEKWVEACEKAFKKVAKTIEVKGFRKGKVPANIVRQYIREDSVRLDAAEDLAQEALDAAIEENNIKLVDRPSLNVKEIDAEHVIMVFSCPVNPDVTLGDYKAIEYSLGEIDVNDEDVDKEVDRYLNQKADLELKEEGAVENNDTVVIDFEGFKDGVAFEGGKGENYDLEIGSNSFIPGFEEQLIGMKADEEKEINVTFPEDYHVEDLKGAEVVFKIKLHEIKKKVLPELNEEFVKSLKFENVNTVEELRAYLKDSIYNRRKSVLENEAEQKLIEDLIACCEVEIPEKMIENEAKTILEEQKNNLIYQGLPAEQVEKVFGKNTEEFLNSFRDEAIKRLKTSLFLSAIAEKENLEADQADIDDYFDRLAKAYNMAVEDIKSYIPVTNIKDDLKLQKALDLLKKKN